MPFSREDADRSGAAFVAPPGPHVVACDRRARRCSVHRRYAVIDVETTGFDPRRDRVVEMACAIVDGGRIVSAWSTLVDPQCPIPARVTRVHGIADEHVAGAPHFEAAVAELVARCVAAQPVAHNAAFDRGFLAPLQARAWLCTLALARRTFPEAPNHRNQTLRTFFGIDATTLQRPIVAHRALDDALVTAQILVRCLEREALARAIARRADCDLPLVFEAA